MKETLKKMHEVIDSHLDETSTNAEAPTENPSNRDQELLITIEATVKQMIERMKLTKESDWNTHIPSMPF